MAKAAKHTPLAKRAPHGRDGIYRLTDTAGFSKSHQQSTPRGARPRAWSAPREAVRAGQGGPWQFQFRPRGLTYRLRSVPAPRALSSDADPIKGALGRVEEGGTRPWRGRIWRTRKQENRASDICGTSQRCRRKLRGRGTTARANVNSRRGNGARQIKRRRPARTLFAGCLHRDRMAP